MQTEPKTFAEAARQDLEDRRRRSRNTTTWAELEGGETDTAEHDRPVRSV